MKNMAKNWKSMLIYILIPVILIGSIILLSTKQNQKDVNYSEIVALFRDDKVSEFSIDLSSGNLVYSLYSDKEENKTEDKDSKDGEKTSENAQENKEVKHKYTVANSTIFLNDISEYVDAHNSNPENKDNQIVYNYIKGSNTSMWSSMLPMLLISILLMATGWFMVKKMTNAVGNDTNRTLSFGKAHTKVLVDDEKRKTTFEDVAGCDEEKEELAEIVDFLKDPKKYNDLGARIPKGVLLVGPPGTGKTLLARAVAGEAGAPFLSISGSDFVEMYVGVGASRVRDLFDQAKKQSPAIIFIDEIDAVGRHRGAGMGGGHDEREQTLNQLLVEMDGFGANEGVIIIAATNRPDILDPALLRPGRFDRQITVGRPDTEGREAILRVHAKKKPLAPDVDLRDIAKGTIGFTGADLENLLNEAALLAARKGLKAITKPLIAEAMIKVVMGTEKKSRKISEKENRLTAFHEAGHAVATYYLDSQDPVHEISIIPRGMAGGYTMSLPEHDKSYNSKNEMLDELVVLLGGRIAEALTLGDISTGASNDIERASDIARKMVTRYGMSDLLGPITFGDTNDEVFIGKDYGHVKNYSEETAAKIDEEVNDIIKNAYKRCEDILKLHSDKLNLVATELLAREKLNGEQFELLMTRGYIDEKSEENSDDADSSNVDFDAEVAAESEKSVDFSAEITEENVQKIDEKDEEEINE